MLSNFFYIYYDKLNTFINKHIDLLIYIATISCFVIYLAVRIKLIFAYSPDVSLFENNNIWNVQKVLLGNKIYTNPEEAPFEIYQYMPMSQYPVIWVSKGLSLKPGIDLKKIYEVARTLGLFYMLICIGFVFFALTKWFKISTLLACITSVISFIGLTGLSFTLRPDGLFTFTFIISLLFFLRYLKNEKTVDLVMTSFFSVLAIFTKQNGIQLPIIYFGFLFVFTNLKTLGKFTLFYFCFFFLFFFWFYFFLGHQFLKSILIGINNPSSFRWAYRVWNEYFFNYFPFVIGFLYVSYEFLKREKNNIEKFLSLAIIGTFLFAIVTLTKKGSWINYFSEFFVIGNIAIAFGLNSLLKNNSLIGNKIKTLIFVFICFWGTNIISQKGYAYFEKWYWEFDPKKNFYEEKEIADFIINQNIPKGTYIYTPLKHLKNFIPQYSILPNTEFYHLSSIDLSKVRKYSLNGKLAYIILPSSEFPDYIMKNLNIEGSNYKLIKKINKISIYKHEQLF